MCQSLGDCVGRNVEIYADIVEVVSKDMSTYVQDLSEVLQKFIENNLTLNSAKRFFWN